MIQFNTKEELNDWILSHENPLELLEVEGADGNDALALAEEMIRKAGLGHLMVVDIFNFNVELRRRLEHQFLVEGDEGINEANREAERGSYDE